MRIFATIGGIAVVAVLAGRLAAPPESVVASEPVPPPDWTEVDRPRPAFALVALPDEAAPRYAIRRHVLGGRKDVIGWGEAASPSGMVEIYRPGSELERAADAAGEIAARTMDLGPVGRPTLMGTIDTKFGPLSLIAFASKLADTTRNCLGFVRIFDEPALQITGWYCNGGPEIVDRGALACTLDNLTLISAASEPKVAELFARAETRRTFCGKKSPILAATPRRNDWIDAASDPKLRGRLAGR